ncbi:Pin2-interacting protein X1 [Trypanosoma conorhini]|uniref:PinX1-related protein 1 n=1 Tax=Trypanosoma conorhini TaxID=83891 RepID=A0A422Q9V6_9TRYP|nr:Pin2-interacting protein X1 [Trypanosoma conorhini]RNF26741.1 Pin2-interacting protein X1 [Trypanosoma conorhini]
MCDDPNGTRWSRSANNIGKSMLKRSGWTEGSGLGRNQEGVTSHIKTRRKDGVMGVGYEGGVQEAWSTQSVGFADVLSRIKSAVASGSSDSEEGETAAAGTNGASGPRGGRHTGMYAKRHALKTELLRAKNGASAAEILGSASSARKRARDGGGEGGEDAALLLPTLRSPLLQRVMVRAPGHEPRPASTDDGEAEVETVRVTKPRPRPPRCTDTPFLAPGE